MEIKDEKDRSSNIFPFDNCKFLKFFLCFFVSMSLFLTSHKHGPNLSNGLLIAVDFRFTLRSDPITLVGPLEANRADQRLSFGVVVGAVTKRDRSSE